MNEQANIDNNSKEAAAQTSIGGDNIEVSAVENSDGVAVGEKSQAATVTDGGMVLQSQRDIILGSDTREDQFDLARNWIKHQSSMREFDLSKRDLSDMYFRGADFQNADLNDANLRDSDLRQANFSRAKINGANLSRTNLEGANMSRTSLVLANLRKANLGRADLRKADLQGTDLRGANLRGTDLRDANFNDAIYSHKTHWPERFDHQAAGVVLETKKPKKSIPPKTTGNVDTVFE